MRSRNFQALSKPFTTDVDATVALGYLSPVELEKPS
jgi:hypothetical protein